MLEFQHSDQFCEIPGTAHPPVLQATLRLSLKNYIILWILITHVSFCISKIIKKLRLIGWYDTSWWGWAIIGHVWPVFSTDYCNEMLKSWEKVEQTRHSSWAKSSSDILLCNMVCCTKWAMVDSTFKYEFCRSGWWAMRKRKCTGFPSSELYSIPSLEIPRKM